MAGCDVDERYVLQSYYSCTFCMHKTRGQTQFWTELAGPTHSQIIKKSILKTHCHLSSSSHPSHLARITSCVSACCYRHVPYDVINKRYLASFRICLTFHKVIERYRFHRFLCFHCVFCVRVFCILFCTNRVTISY